ncbi:hypothetical protein [Moraxella nonliquefaciens]|uniref:hypothetical protein n=1 Tax=Moraxella nonliquefaciens TaxID=478 RepID=UPI001D171AB3|nr:hypothetical protein [Moraxella nonliquefaciens]
MPLTGQSGLGYGKIDPAHKTSTTHTAITDQAGLSHINTKNFKQKEVQNQLNPIITNDFNKEQVLTELGAQVVITTEFGKEAPKAVAEFSQYQQDAILSQLQNIEHLGDEQINDILSEAAKWSEGGVYRTALHTAMGLLATGTVEGGLSAGTTAYTIPKIDEYLKEQGFDKEVRDTALLALSAGIGATVGGDTASTANNVGQVQWNYLSHESALKSSKLNARQRRHIQALKDAGAVSYEAIERKYDACKDDACREQVKKEWQRESDRTRQIELDLVKQGVLTWEDFDQFTGGFIGVDTPHLAAIQNKRHTLAAMEISSWTQPDATARNEALRRDGGVTPGSTEDLLMQAGAGTVGAAVAGRNARNATPTLSIGSTNPKTGHRILGVHTIERGGAGDYIVEGTKSSTKGTLISVSRQYYENPGHHDPSGRGLLGYNRTKSVIPPNHLELWQRSIMTPDGNRWAVERKNNQTIYHRFQNDGNGNFHWNGLTNGVTQSGQSRAIDINHVPSSIRGN